MMKNEKEETPKKRNKQGKIDIPKEELYKIIINMLFKELKSVQTTVAWMKEEYGIKDTQGYSYIKRAKIHFAKHINNSEVETLVECISVLKNIRELAYEVGNIKEAIKCTVEIGKLHQLYVEKQEIEHKVNIEVPLFPKTDKKDKK